MNCSGSIISISSSTSSDSNYRVASTVGDLEADADSLTCTRQSGLSSNDQFENNDGYKHVSKRPRSGTTDNNSMNDLFGSHCDWDEDDERGGGGLDIHILLSDFGEFGDLFENDTLPFGEPPGTAESPQALTVFSVPDCCDEVIASPCKGLGLDVTDEMLLHVLELAGSYYSTQPTGEFEHLLKAEAVMTFAPEYRAVETATISELCSSIFSSPYLPRSREVGSSHSSSNAYIYGAMPPPSPCLNASKLRRSLAM